MRLSKLINKVLSDKPSEWFERAQYRADHADELAVENAKKLKKLIEDRKEQNKNE